MSEGQPVNVLLSREELLVVLRSLGVTTIPGLDDDPQGPLTAEQQALALTVAERALQARALIERRDDSWAIHNALLSAVGVCAFPQKMFYAYHWPAGAPFPVRYFGHQRGGECIVHTRPAEVLHLFTRLPSVALMVEQLLAFCAWRDPAPAPRPGFSLNRADLAQVRSCAERGETAAAQALLIEHQAAAETAQALVETLAHQPRVSIIQLWRRGASGLEAREFTLLQNSTHAWLWQTSETTAQTVYVQPATTPAVQALLSTW
jgi:hypothetical protein